MHYPNDHTVTTTSPAHTWAACPDDAVLAYPATITFLEDLGETMGNRFPRLSLSTVTQRAYELTSHAALKGDYATAALMAEAFCRIALYQPHSAHSESKSLRTGLRAIAAELVRIVYPFDGVPAVAGSENRASDRTVPADPSSRTTCSPAVESCPIPEGAI